MIADILWRGKENARSGRELAEHLSISRRDLSTAIRNERRQGQPICATTSNNNPGYYLAASPEELDEYCDNLLKRATELFKIREAIIKAFYLPDTGGKSEE